MSIKSTRSHLKVLKTYSRGLQVTWTLIIAASLAWNLYQNQTRALELAHQEAVAHFNKDQGFRLWGTRHGGVYVPVTEETPPSPYLSHIPERDIATPSGKKLTLLNPAYMVRQLMEDYRELYGVRGHITGRVVLRPGNEPDAWEEAALRTLEAGAPEVMEITDIDGASYMRMIRPMVMEPGCMKCHGHLGFKVGEVRGGVSVAIPMAPYRDGQLSAAFGLAGTHGFIWLLGIGLIGVGTRQIKGHIQETQEAEEEVRRLNTDLERRVEERTEQLATELAERKRAEARVKEHESRLRSVVETAADGIITINGRGLIQSFNSAAEEIFGWTQEEIIGKPINLLMNADAAAHHDEYLEAFLRTGKARIIGSGREVTARRKDGSDFPLYIAVSVVRLDDGAMFTGIVRDLTQQKKAEAALRVAKEQAEKANRAKSQFLSSMSHELRTPLNGILGFAQLLEYSPKSPLTDKQADYVGMILKAGNHLLGLINEVLDLSKIESGNLTLSIESVSPKAAFKDCIALIEPLAEKRGITIIDNISGKKDDPHVRADLVRLKQILVNLTSNAIKYNRNGGSVTLDCSCDTPCHGAIRFSVTDTGAGIPEDKLSDLFEPFNRLGQETGEIEGSGIGLTITKTLIELMNGRIGVESEVDRGSTFWFELPIAADEMEKVSETGADTAASLKPEALGNHTILYVEDNPANLTLMEELISNFPSLTLLSAPNAEEGLDITRSISPDLIIMDINLPGMDGYQALRELKGNPDTRPIPVIALSASAMPADVKRGIRAGFRSYLTKPIDIGEMVHALESILDESPPDLREVS